MDSCPWQVLHVLSNHEKRVAQHLTVRSVAHYLPLYQERTKWSDRTVVSERPLFTGYVFVRVLAGKRISILSTPGVLRLLGDEARDTVSSLELDRIRDGLAKGLVLRPHARLPVGTKVRVRKGVFAGTEGTVSELRHQCRVVISLDAIHQCFSLDVEIGDVEVLKKPVAGREMRSMLASGY